MSVKITLDGVALVTGAASGIGKEVAFTFAESGCKAVVFADINENGVHDAIEESKKYATSATYAFLALKVDVASSKSVQSMVDVTVERFGRIDYFVNAAGVPNLSPNPVSDLDLDLFNMVININLKGTVNCLRSVSAAMKRQDPVLYTPASPRTARHSSRTQGRGSIITLSSTNGIMPNAGNTSYVSAKHGVFGATKVAALDLAKDGIRVNAVLPGVVDTPMMQNVFDRVPEIKPLIEDSVPLWQRMANVDEIADAVVFLCSPSMTYATGMGFVIDGGLTLSSARLG